MLVPTCKLTVRQQCDPTGDRRLHLHIQSSRPNHFFSFASRPAVKSPRRDPEGLAHARRLQRWNGFPHSAQRRLRFAVSGGLGSMRSASPARTDGQRQPGFGGALTHARRHRHNKARLARTHPPTKISESVMERHRNPRRKKDASRVRLSVGGLLAGQGNGVLEGPENR
jgi:hypothetical protein